MQAKQAVPYQTLVMLILLVLGSILALLSSPTRAAPLAHLESPAPEAFLRSGIGLIRGWACEAKRVEVSIDGGPLLATAHGTDRPDTAQTCGRTDTGFGRIYNWNRLGKGLHHLRALADGVEFANVNFVVATLGGEFLTGLKGDYTVPDFPKLGDVTPIRWSEPHQNFVFTQPVTIPPVANPSNHAGAFLESPTQGSSESGIGLIRGWVCAASRVEVSIDGGPLLATAHGTDRPDTAGTCGRTDTGFGLTYNWNRAGAGVHNLRALADGVEFANVNFAVTTLGSEFLTGSFDKIRLLRFPGTGTAAAPQADSGTDLTTTLQWSEPDQNFLIATSTAAGEEIALISLVTDLSNKFALLGVGAQTNSATNAFGMRASKDAQGQVAVVDGLTWTDVATGGWADLSLGQDDLPAVYQDATGARARLEQFTATAVNISFLNANGQVVAGPITTPLNGALVQRLQQRLNQLRTTAPSPVAAPQAAAVAAASDTRRLSLNALLVNAFWSGGGATGETLCALRTAAATAGLAHSLLLQGCKSSLLTSWRARTTAAESRAATDASDIDPEAQQALQFVADVVEAPCAPPNDSAGCLIPAATELQQSEAVQEVPPDGGSTPSTVQVPDTVGLSQSDAVTALQQAGLTLGTVTQAASASVPAGSVISQNPAAGAAVAPGTAVNLVVSSGPQPVTVPNVVGLSQSAASSALTGAGLTLGTVTSQVSATVPEGNVISQNPEAGASVAPGTAVDLVVSSESPPVTVPNVVGLSQSTASSALREVGLTTGTVTSQVSATVPEGNVISQNPEAGTSVAPGAAVDLVVSLGPPITVPNVVGLSQSAASGALQEVGLTIGTVIQQVSLSVPAGTVISQNPAAGAAVAPGTAVDLVVSSESPPVTVPNVVGLSQSAASSALQEVGLTIGTVTSQTSTTVPAGSVISQNPAAGVVAAPGMAVDLVVSLGPPVTVPNVVGLSQSAAASILGSVGLPVGTVYSQPSSCTLGAVIGQSPPAGTSVAPGTPINLIIAVACSGPTLCPPTNLCIVD